MVYFCKSLFKYKFIHYILVGFCSLNFTLSTGCILSFYGPFNLKVCLFHHQIDRRGVKLGHRDFVILENFCGLLAAGVVPDFSTFFKGKNIDSVCK